jgi:hypothetical protein
VTAWAFGAAGLSASQGLTIAVAYGELKACLFFAGVPTFEADPSAWKKTMHLTTDRPRARLDVSEAGYLAIALPDWSRLASIN